MKLFITSSIAALLASMSLAGCAYIPHSKIMEVSEDTGNYDIYTGVEGQPKYTVFLDEDELGHDEIFHGIEKRGYYTCYNRQTTSVAMSDCQAVIDRIKASDTTFSVPNGLCLTWYQGTCMSRLCTKIGANRGLNKTSDSMVNELQGVILDDCVKIGLEGMSGDCSNMDSNCGTYRLTLEHHGSEVLGGPPPS
ncbi:hypothetical protein SCUP234_06752 [Seiridium cupressi]|uniref:Lipoprotein n=1 Tax=Seiridium unicorne TaxID=138068 RepID=A0ABR2UIJ9_9PEZI